MDPLDFLDSEELLRFLHVHKTELSCMENPRAFLRQLRDHDLIPDQRYLVANCRRSKETLKDDVYEILDWLEKEQSEHIHLFWRCIFKETIMNNYPLLKELRRKLMDGSYHFETQLPEKAEIDERKQKRRSVEDEEEEHVKKKRKPQRMCDDEEQQPSTSSQLTPGQRKLSRKISFSSPLKKGETDAIWNWPIYKTLLPVTCGSLEGTLSRNRLVKGEKCILFQDDWLTPSEFEKRAGKANAKNWKLTIKCSGTTLGKLFKRGILESAGYRGRHKIKPRQAKRSLFPSDQLNTVSVGHDGEDTVDEDEDENEEEEEDDLENQEDQVKSDGAGESEEQSEPKTSKSKVLKVTCGSLSGTLHQKRFGSGTRGKSVRTETSWLTPEEFVREASCPTNSWRKDIICKGKPLGVLIKEKVLEIHSLLCKCSLCQPSPIDQENQKNDDECCICKSDNSNTLVVCDYCPRSFHQKCHLPHIDDALLGDDKPWMCTFCVSRQEWCSSRNKRQIKEALSLNISQHLLECHCLLLFLYCADEELTFALDPTLYLENYSTVIQTPMWLDKVANKLLEKKYQKVKDFVSDIELIFTNCESYNQANPEVLATGQQLVDLFYEEFKRVFNTCEVSAD